MPDCFCRVYAPVQILGQLGRFLLFFFRHLRVFAKSSAWVCLRACVCVYVCRCVLSSLCVRIVVVAAVAKLFRAITAALNFLFSIFHCKAREAKRIDTVPHAALTWTALLLHCIPHTDTRPQTVTRTHTHTLKHLRLLMAGK